MKTSSDKIPLADYKVLLIQLISRLLDRLIDTGIKPHSKRNYILLEIKNHLRDLEREFKRDVVIAETAEHKRDIFMDIYDSGCVPKWILITLIEALTEETTKINGNTKKKRGYK